MENMTKLMAKMIRIRVADFEIESNNHELTQVEDCMNRLIKKNKDFAGIRRKKIVAERMGMIG